MLANARNACKVLDLEGTEVNQNGREGLPSNSLNEQSAKGAARDTTTLNWTAFAWTPIVQCAALAVRAVAPWHMFPGPRPRSPTPRLQIVRQTCRCDTQAPEAGIKDLEDNIDRSTVETARRPELLPASQLLRLGGEGGNAGHANTVPCCARWQLCTACRSTQVDPRVPRSF